MMNNLQSSAFVAKTTQLLSSVACLRLLFVMLLTLSVSANAWADYTITFKTSGSNTDGSNAQTNIANLISSGGGYVSTISASRAYNGKDGFGVKLGSSSSVGNVAMTLTNSGNNIGQIKASKLIVNAAYFKSGPTLKVTATYTDNTTSVQSLSLTANIAAYDVALTSTKTLKSIKIESVKGSSECRAYCHSIKVVAASAAVTTYTVTYDLNGGTGTPPTQASVAAGGTFTLAASSGFSKAGYSFAGWNDGTTTYKAGDTYTMPAKAVTLKAQWTALTKYTVNWYVNGSKAHSQTDVAGTALTNIPNLEDYECEDKVFVGWTTQSSYEDATNAPTDLITNTSGLTMPENGKDYYAVFAEASGDGEDGWQKVTSTDQVKDSEMYAFISFDEAYYLANAQSTSNPPVKSVSKTNGILNVTDEMKWIASANSGGFEFKSYSNNDYYLWGGSGNDAIRINTTSLKANATEVWYTKILNTYGVVIYHNASTDGAKYLATNGSTDWRNYLNNTLSNTNRVANLYKFTSGTTYSNYTTQCSTQTVPSLSASVSSLAFGDVTVNSSEELEFTLSGSNLTADATLALSGTNAGMFSVSPTPVTPSNGSITNPTITVTYTPTAKASHSATLTISSTGAESIEIPLSGTGVAQMANYTVKHYKQNLDGTYPTEPTETEYSSGEVGTNVTPAVKSYEGFTAPSTTEVTIAADGKTVVEYYYTRNSYTLTWDVNEGNDLTGEYTSGSVKFGATITKPADPTRAGYNFSGWHNGTAIVTPATTMPADNLTYTAQWKATYTVTFLNHGEEVEKVTVEAGDPVTLPTTELTSCDTEKYPHFYGWTANPIDGVGTTEPADLITANFTPNNSVTLHAVFVDQLSQEGGWQVVTSATELVAGKIYTIGSYGSPDSGVAMGEQNEYNRGTASWETGTPVELILGGSTDAWTLYDNSEGGYLYAASSSKNYLKTQITLNENGKWAITISNKKATIEAKGSNTHKYMRYNPNNGSPIFSCYEKSSSQSDIFLLTKSMATQPTAYITSCCETPAPTNGTYTNVTGSGSSMSVKLTWEDAANAGSYHITGENLADDVYATNYTVSGLTECETYTFYVSAHPTEGCESPKLAIEVTPYIPKTVTFVDGSTTTQKTTSCSSETVTVPNASKDCYTSVWKDQSGNVYTNNQEFTPTENLTLTADYTIIQYEITFVDEDGTNILQSSTVDCGTTPSYTGETPTKDADAVYQYTFAAWSPAIVPANDNATYTATYNKTKRTYTVDWYVNGKLVKNETVEAGELATAPDLSKIPCGAVLAGWTDAPNGEYVHETSTLYPGEEPSIEILENKTLYAVFADIDE